MVLIKGLSKDFGKLHKYEKGFLPKIPKIELVVDYTCKNCILFYKDGALQGHAFKRRKNQFKEVFS